MNKAIEIKKGKINFKTLWKIGKIDVDRVTFIKYSIERNQSLLSDDNETIVLGEIIGEETHRCYPSIIQQVSGRTGEIIVGFDVERKGKLVRVNKIKETELN